MIVLGRSALRAEDVQSQKPSTASQQSTPSLPACQVPAVDVTQRTHDRQCMSSWMRCKLLTLAGCLQADLDVEEDFHVPPLFQLATPVDESRLKDAAEEVLSLPDNARYAAPGICPVRSARLCGCLARPSTCLWNVPYSRTMQR